MKTKRKKFDASQVPGFIPLDSVSVATPCHADWNAMTGDDQLRFCPSCAKNVYNLSAMTSDEAQALLQEKEGRLCIRFFQREDGTMLTRDCPVGAAQRLQTSPPFALWASAMSLVVAALALGSPSFLATASAQPDSKAGPTPLQSATPQPTATPTPEPLQMRMGDFAVAPVAPTAKANPAPVDQKGSPLTEVRGEATVKVTPAPALPLVTMGKPSIKPKSTPAPHKAVKTGERQIKTTTGLKPTPHPLMGRFIVSPVTKTPAKPGQSKTPKASKSKAPREPKS